MKTFDVTGCRAEIVYPTTILSQYTAKNKVFAICNASLYDMSTREPCGTINKHGEWVHGSGGGTKDNVHGCGVKRDDPKDVLTFCFAWDYYWKDFLSGYNSPVQNGKYVEPDWIDTYVFGSKNVRVAVGKKKDGTMHIITDEGVTLKQFAQNCIKLGFDTVVNLDGGGSRHIYYNGITQYMSYRVPYNAIAFYKDNLPPAGPTPGNSSTQTPTTTPQTPAQTPSNSNTQTPTPSNKPGTRQLITGCPYAEPTTYVKMWSTGDPARWAQWYLKEHGYYKSTIDGLFFSGSVSALKSFQKDHGLTIDGVCGPATREELKYRIIK